ncbi:probable isoprenylcysteine alpha-carbonyl methylesterase ICMEL2 isoform X1 [Punica granatum]|uniref:protein-S-isoprenylcysteine alpha-carbonyl methylesterase n=1 Tax=Punica granatum TaxID=22663 RepID=A0A6P8CX30_PUNGR|nr:probable isoprenylcysteine alpha-carbonyl methylesterase ICMEL2 isoform X1 [Punica granatum]
MKLTETGGGFGFGGYGEGSGGSAFANSSSAAATNLFFPLVPLLLLLLLLSLILHSSVPLLPPQIVEEQKEIERRVNFITGGAWIIGYKAWGSLLGQQLTEKGIIVACIDYRNFPQGTISDMVTDALQGISFVCNHITEYGGDPNRIYVMGQSAGAHVAACALMEQAIKESAEGESTSWSLSQIKAYFGLSGG